MGKRRRDHEPTLTGALKAAGFTHRKANRDGLPLGAHDIFDASGKIVATLKAADAWSWLREQLREQRLEQAQKKDGRR